jgi:hypothetical protein
VLAVTVTGPLSVVFGEQLGVTAEPKTASMMGHTARVLTMSFIRLASTWRCMITPPDG